MKYILSILTLILLSCAQQKNITEKNSKNDKIKILYLTGGSYHKYMEQERIIRKNLYKSLSNIEMTTHWFTTEKSYFRGVVKNLINPPKDVSNYDVLIFNMCLAKNTETDFVNSVLNIATKKPAIFVHCAFHTFWNIDKRQQWVEILGIDSRKHNRSNKLQIHLVDKTSPVTNFMNKSSYFTNSRDELYVGKSYSEDIKVLLKANDYNNSKQILPALWEIDRPKQKSLNIIFPHSDAELETATYQSFLANAVLYLVKKPLPYYQYFTAQHKLLRGENDKLFSYSPPNYKVKDVEAVAPYQIKFNIPYKANYFVAKFKVNNHTKKSGGLFFQLLVDGQFLFQTPDLFANQQESIKFKLPKGAKFVELKIASYDKLYGKGKSSENAFQITKAGFIK